MFDDSVPVPATLEAHRGRGNYRGAFASRADLGNILRPALQVSAGLSREARVEIVDTLRVRSEIWVVEHLGLVHVFGAPDSLADQIIARERPDLTGEDEAPGASTLFFSLEARAS
ncbi:hypothetical protein [Nannocystis punicea]|uniref:Uncharacterized protein n=1 Tax=Nannocystis punicea TaxID=2995304 RepID=A0ABY7GXY0_9BACT|nr:hypothetical protein [Nannocystis poenicansa]WAS91838.1 hypothetical protein O0S08_37115 [Nannocystis poenicansa]